MIKVTHMCLQDSLSSVSPVFVALSCSNREGNTLKNWKVQLLNHIDLKGDPGVAPETITFSDTDQISSYVPSVTFKAKLYKNEDFILHLSVMHPRI